MANMRIAVTCASGDPRSDRTWSGTPYNLIKALEGLGVKVAAVSASLSRWERGYCRLMNRVMGFTGFIDRGPMARWIAARRTERACLQAGVKTVLHTGTLDLPGTARGTGLKRYLFCDYTWDLWANYTSEIRRFSPRSARISEKQEQEAYGQITWFFPISQYVKENLIERYGIKREEVTVVGTGGGKITPFHGGKDYVAGPVLFVAKERFEEKGGALLLEGFRIANKKNPSLKLVLAGKAVNAALASNVPNVTVAGHVPWEELERLFASAALFAMPAFCEPWGLVYVEALSCKTPILGLARNSLPELTQNGRFGFLVDKPEPQLIADALLGAAADPKKLEQMGAEGQQYCLSAFSWSRTAGAILDRMKDWRPVIQ